MWWRSFETDLDQAKHSRSAKSLQLEPWIDCLQQFTNTTPQVVHGMGTERIVQVYLLQNLCENNESFQETEFTVRRDCEVVKCYFRRMPPLLLITRSQDPLWCRESAIRSEMMGDSVKLCRSTILPDWVQPHRARSAEIQKLSRACNNMLTCYRLL